MVKLDVNLLLNVGLGRGKRVLCLVKFSNRLVMCRVRCLVVLVRLNAGPGTRLNLNDKLLSGRI